MNRHGKVRNELDVALLCYMFFFEYCINTYVYAHTFAYYIAQWFVTNWTHIQHLASRWRNWIWPAPKNHTYILFQSFLRRGSHCLLGVQISFASLCTLYKCNVMVYTFLSPASFGQQFVRFTHIILGSCILFIPVV